MTGRASTQRGRACQRRGRGGGPTFSAAPRRGSRTRPAPARGVWQCAPRAPPTARGSRGPAGPGTEGIRGAGIWDLRAQGRRESEGVGSRGPAGPGTEGIRGGWKSGSCGPRDGGNQRGLEVGVLQAQGRRESEGGSRGPAGPGTEGIRGGWNLGPAGPGTEGIRWDWNLGPAGPWGLAHRSGFGSLAAGGGVRPPRGRRDAHMCAAWGNGGAQAAPAA
jgi:hypothetical protein